MLPLLLPTLLAVASGPIVEPITWQIDPTHSELTFRVRHLVSRVPGTFTSWGGTIVADPNDLADGTVEVTIDAASITTRNERRDTDLRSSNFFAVDSFPKITFKSTKVAVQGSAITVTGDLTMRGVKESVTLTGEYGGIMGSPEARRQRIGFTARTTINRLDFGVSWNRAVEGGGVLLGNEVEITINIEAIRAS